MSVQEEKLTAIADAIRDADGAAGAIPAKDFPDRIRAMRGVELVSIEVTTPPDKIHYYAGESFDPTGMVVTGHYRKGSAPLSGVVTGYTITPAEAMPAGATAVTITYAEGGVVKTCEQAVSVVKRSVAVPTQPGGLTYNEQPQSPVWTGYDSSVMTKTEEPWTDAGSYSTVFGLKDPALYQWTDGSTEEKRVAWEIEKAPGSLSLSTTAVTLNKAAPSQTIEVTREGDGAISAISSNTGIATIGSIDQATGKITINSANGKDGTAVITIKVAEDKNHTAPADGKINVTAQFTAIYGAEWDGTSTTKLSRTDAAAGFTDPVPAVNNGTGSSSFDGLMPWAGMVKEEDPAAGTLVKIPKFWYKFTKNGNTLKLQIADGQVDGFYVSPAHADRGDGKGERDFVYVGRYHCHTSNYKSQTGGKPKINITRSAARTGIHNLGATIWQFDLAMLQTIQMLYLVEFADWNSQAKIGYGGGNNSGSENVGATDSMQYHTGTKQSSRTTYGVGVQYRWIEGLWDNVYDWVDGSYYDNNKNINIIMNPSKFSDSTNGTIIGKAPPVGWPTAMTTAVQNSVQWIYPTATNGSNTTYIPDGYICTANQVPCHGGRYTQSLDFGIFFLNCEMPTYTADRYGCRLQKLP